MRRTPAPWVLQSAGAEGWDEVEVAGNSYDDDGGWSDADVPGNAILGDVGCIQGSYSSKQPRRQQLQLMASESNADSELRGRTGQDVLLPP